MNKLINFLKCSNISERVKIVEDIINNLSDLHNTDVNVADIPDMVYPECVRVVPEKDIKFNVD
jgi:hypothetical protein